MSQFIGTAPGVDFREQIEEASKSEGVMNAIGIVGVAVKGPTEAVLLTSPQQCINLFGNPHTLNSAVQGALVCLRNSREVWFKRVISKNGRKGTTWEAPVVADGEEAPVVAEGEEAPENTKPWAVFQTKEITELCNGCSITLTWVNVGTADVPDYKVDYVFKNSAGDVIESYRCSEDPEDDLYLGNIVTRYSNHVTVEITGEVTNRDAVTYVIAGGNSGLDADVKEIVGTGNSGMKAFYDPEAIDVSTLIVPTWADRTVWEEGIKIGEYRKDIVFIPSLPIGLTPAKVTDLVRGAGEFTTSGLQFDRTFIPVYWPNGLKRNPTSGAMEVVDIVPYVASAYARSDGMSNIWTTPAGVKRGILQDLDGLEYKTTKEERDSLYAEEVNVNSIVELKGYGITIMGARTSKVYKLTDGNTALRYINIRRLCNYARKVVLNESMHNLFDQNDHYTWNDWKMRLDPYFRAIKEGRGLYDYQIIMDESTVSQADIDAGRMPGVIRIAPVKPNEYIIINFIVAKDGTTSFSEDIAV